MAKMIRRGALFALLCTAAIPALGVRVTELSFDKTAKALPANDLSQFTYAYRASQGAFGCVTVSDGLS